MSDQHCARFPLVDEHLHARTWLKVQSDLGLSSNTIAAYGRGLNDYLHFACSIGVDPLLASREHIALYVAELRSRPSPRSAGIGTGAKLGRVGLANATMQLRLTAVRLFYDFLVEEGVRETNPVGRGRYTPGKCYGAAAERGLLRRYRTLPWIPTDEEWRSVLRAACRDSLRNRLMLALQYDGALRREELCSLESGDLDPAFRVVTVRAETTKNRQTRVVTYSAATGDLLRAYLRGRKELGAAKQGPLFISESRRNHGKPITIWTWSKVVERLASWSGVHRFTTHTPRHLCLTDLARAGWDIHEIAHYAGHRSTDSTLTYIHLSGREFAEKLERTMARVRSVHGPSDGEDRE